MRKVLRQTSVCMLITWAEREQEIANRQGERDKRRDTERGVVEKATNGQNRRLFFIDQR